MEFFQPIIPTSLLILEKVSNYIDPGSATAVMAMIIGAIAGVGMTLKLYWFKIKEKISR